MIKFCSKTNECLHEKNYIIKKILEQWNQSCCNVEKIAEFTWQEYQHKKIDHQVTMNNSKKLWTAAIITLRK